MERKTRFRPTVRLMAANAALAAIVAGLFLSLNLLGGGRVLPAQASVFGNGAVYTGGNTERIGLCCTAGWNASAIEKMLTVLERNGVKITFALGLEAVRSDPGLVKRIIADGHELAVLAGNDAGTVKAEAELTAELIESLGAARPKLLVFTGSNAAARHAAKTLKMVPVAGTTELVTVRGTAEQILESAESRSRGGDIVLCAPTQALAEVLPSILEYYSSLGLTTSTVSGTIYD